MAENVKKEKLWDIFLIFLKLGLTSFGGPLAHIGYFRDEFVTRRKWLGDAQFTEFSSLCHFLPGPSSSQLGMILGLYRGGFSGSFAAWVGFTLPSAVIMMMLGIGIIGFDEQIPKGLIHGLKILAVAVVLQALIGMTRSLTPDLPRLTIALFSCAFVLFMSGVLPQPLVIILGGIAGFLFLQKDESTNTKTSKLRVRKKHGLLALITFFICLGLFPILSALFSGTFFDIVDGFYRTGSLVFGGGHVVLPLLNGETVATGAVAEDKFLAGYAAAQALPGPLFTFASYLGAVMGAGMISIVYSLVALFAIFAPAFLLIFGVIPFWDGLRQKPYVGEVLKGVNASVVGLLAAVLYTPLWTGSILSWLDFTFCLGVFVGLFFLRLPVWLCVIASAVIGMLIF